jgi:hypothetical protein
MHHAGANALSRLLRFPAPVPDQQTVACPRGRREGYREVRSKPLLKALGASEITRPYYLCPHCHNGQFPVDVELDIENTQFSPSVRRMQAMVCQNVPFEQGREQLSLLAGLDVTAKSVKRNAEVIGEDIVAREQQRIQRAVQLDLPVVIGERVPILYIQTDGIGVPVVKKETFGRKGKTEGQPADTREVKLGCLFTQTAWDKKGFAIREDTTTYTGAIEPAEAFGKPLYLEAWQRGWGRVPDASVPH